jgi:hypothetical protein
MWFVEKNNGDLEQVHNRATAEQLAKEYDTRYMDGWSQQYYEVHDD